MTFTDWTAWLETRNPAPLIAPGLERTVKALKHSGLYSTHRPERTIHIAGTNGKGTTARALEHLLHASGQSVGLYTSPHLVSTCERIRAGQKNISETDFVALCEKHRETIISCELSHFEALTVIALDYFLNVAHVEWMIFEIGLGGTWDATNAIDHATSVITSIGFDHMHILGTTLEAIADNKFGIIQKGNRVFHREYSKAVLAKLLLQLERTNSKGRLTTIYTYAVRPNLIPTYTLKYKNLNIPLRLAGKRSIENMSTAIDVFLGLGFSERSLLSLETMEWPARMTELKVPNSPCPIYLSGDHNEQGLESMCEILEHSTYSKLHVVLGLSKNRDHKPFVDRLLKLRDVSITFTKPQFQGVVPGDGFTPFLDSPQAVLQHVFNGVTSETDLILVTGSLYLCGDFLRADFAKTKVFAG